MTKASITNRIADLKSNPEWSISSDRLTACVFRKENLNQSFIDGMQKKEVNQFLEFRHKPPNFDEQVAFIEQNLADSSSLYLALATREDQALIGSIRLYEICDFNKRCHIGIMIVDQNHWGKGYASEAILLVSDYCHDNLGIRRITAGCYAENVGSKRAFLKAGYELEGELKAYWTSGTIDDPGEAVSEFFLGSVRDG